MRGSKFPADMHNSIWSPIYIPSFMKIGSVVSEELRWQDFGTDGRTDRRTDGRTDGRSDCTPRPALAFGDTGKNNKNCQHQTKILWCFLSPFQKMIKKFKCIKLHVKSQIVTHKVNWSMNSKSNVIAWIMNPKFSSRIYYHKHKYITPYISS